MFQCQDCAEGVTLYRETWAEKRKRRSSPAYQQHVVDLAVGKGRCQWCYAESGQPCESPSGLLIHPHVGRI